MGYNPNSQLNRNLDLWLLGNPDYAGELTWQSVTGALSATIPVGSGGEASADWVASDRTGWSCLDKAPEGVGGLITVSGMANNQSMFTWGAWFKVSSLGTRNAIISKGITGIGTDKLIEVRTTGEVRYFVRGVGGLWDITSGTKVTIGQWHRADMSFDGATLIGYLDGLDEATITRTDTPEDDSDSDFTIGDQPTGANLALDGFIDDIRVHNDVMTPQEVAAYYIDSNDGYRSTFPSSSDPFIQSPHLLGVL